MIPRPASRQPIPDHARCVFRGVLFDVYQWEQRLFDGTTAVFEKVKRPDTAYVIPVTPDRKLLLCEQVQPGGTPVVGLLGGRIAAGESPEEGARRELREEAGLEARVVTLWDSYQFLPKIDWVVYTFIARECTPLSSRRLDAGEEIRLIYFSFDEFIRVVSEDRFGDLEVALTYPTFGLGSEPAKEDAGRIRLGWRSPARLNEVVNI